MGSVGNGKNGHLENTDDWHKTEILQHLTASTGITGEDAEETYDAVKSYLTTDYGFLLSPYNVKLIDNFIDKSPKWNAGKIYRGVTMEQYELDKLVSSGEYNSKSVTSWSSDKTIAKDYATKIHGSKPVKVVFILDKPKNATSVKYISLYKSENEILQKSNQSFKVVNVKDVKGIKYITLAQK